jgi:proline iminopeptidase
MGVDYLAELIAELAEVHQVATYQQRGVEPSTAAAPYDIGTQTEDVVAVLDHLGWEKAIVVGHSWGGHLLLYLLVRHPDRVTAACVIDPLGAVGDGGMAEFEAELTRRTPAADRESAAALDQLALAGKASEEDHDEAVRLVWPAYFPSPELAPAYRSIAMSTEAYAATFESLLGELPHLAHQLRGCDVPTVFVAGGASPMPTSSSLATAELLADSTVEIIDGAGHFVWLDRPGTVTRSVERLQRRAEY